MHSPSTNAMDCHGEMEEGDRAKGRESKHRGLDSAIYKAWPSACLINCALFWESRKPAGLQEKRKKEKNINRAFSLCFLVIQMVVEMGIRAIHWTAWTNNIFNALSPSFVAIESTENGSSNLCNLVRHGWAAIWTNLFFKHSLKDASLKR